MKKSNLTLALFGCALLSTSFVASNLDSIAKNEVSVSKTMRSPANSGLERFEDPNHMNSLEMNYIPPIDSSLEGMPHRQKKQIDMASTKTPESAGDEYRKLKMRAQQQPEQPSHKSIIPEDAQSDDSKKKEPLFNANAFVPVSAQISAAKVSRENTEVNSEDEKDKGWLEFLRPEPMDFVQEIIDVATGRDKLKEEIQAKAKEVKDLKDIVLTLTKSLALADDVIVKQGESFNSLIDELEEKENQLKELAQKLLDLAKKDSESGDKIAELEQKLNNEMSQKQELYELLKEIAKASGCKTPEKSMLADLEEKIEQQRLVLAKMESDKDKSIKEAIDKAKEDILAELSDDDKKEKEEREKNGEDDEDYDEDLEVSFTSDFDFLKYREKKYRRVLRHKKRMQEIYRQETRSDADYEELAYLMDESMYQRDMGIHAMRRENSFVTDRQREQYIFERGGMYASYIPTAKMIAGSYNSSYLNDAPIVYSPEQSIQPASYNLDRYGYEWDLNPKPRQNSVLNPVDFSLGGRSASTIQSPETFSMVRGPLS